MGTNYTSSFSKIIDLHIKARGPNWKNFFKARKDLPNPNSVKNQQLTMNINKERVKGAGFWNQFFLRIKGNPGPVTLLDDHNDGYNFLILPRNHSYST